MNYELIVVPMGFNEHIDTDSSRPKCMKCAEKLELVEQFINAEGARYNHTNYEGLFSICPKCGSSHLELLTGDVDFEGPVVLGWN